MILCIISRPGWWIMRIDTRENIKVFVRANAGDCDEVFRWSVA